MRILWALAVVGCSSSSGGSVSGGSGLDVVDSISAVVTTSDGAGGTSSSAQIFFASTSGACSDAGTAPPTLRKGEHYIRIALRDSSDSSSSAPVAAGSYTVYPNTGSLPAKS